MRLAACATALWCLAAQASAFLGASGVARRPAALRSTATPPEQKASVAPLPDEATFTSATARDDGLVVIKFYAPWCRACRGLAPKYERLSAEYGPKNVKFYEMSHKEVTAKDDGAAFLQRIDVNVLPLVQFYSGGARVESFPCGPRKIELLKEKLEKWTTDGGGDGAAAAGGGGADAAGRVVDARRSRQAREDVAEALEAVAPVRDPNDPVAVARRVMARVPLLGSLKGPELDDLAAEARVAEYDAGDVIVTEGDVGRRFFVIVDGECDVFESTKGLGLDSRMPGFSPNSMRTAYGELTNTLGPGSYFGERGLATNEPRMATILAATRVKAVTIERSALKRADGAFDDATRLSNLLESSENFLWGYEMPTSALDDLEAAPEVAKPAASPPVEAPAGALAAKYAKAGGLSLMQRLRLVRSVVRAFDQAAKRSPKWGNPAEKAYRAGLVAQLTDYQRDEFLDTFKILDRDCDGTIGPKDLAALMSAVGRDLGEDELVSVINKANPEVENNKDITAEDFLALMAQAEYSAMFLEAFALLDPYGHGWVESEQLWAMMASLVPADDDAGGAGLGAKVDELIETFGVSDGHIDYQAFVKIMIEGTGDAAPRPAA